MICRIWALQMRLLQPLVANADCKRTPVGLWYTDGLDALEFNPQAEHGEVSVGNRRFGINF